MSRKKWTKQRVIEGIQDWHQNGMPSEKEWRGALGQAAYRLFGSRAKVLEAAGFQATREPKWTKQRVIKEIRMLHQQGTPMSRIWRHNAALSAAAGRCFGSRSRALEAAGLEPKYRRSWTPQRVIAAIQAWHERGLPVTSIREKDMGLHQAARRYFGTWVKAVLAAGLEAKPHSSWSERRIIARLRAWDRQRAQKSSVWRDDRVLAVAATRYFGSLQQAFEAAELEPASSRRSSQHVMEAIQDRYVRGLPMQSSRCEDEALLSAARRCFGDWSGALAAAGLTGVASSKRAAAHDRMRKTA